MSTITAAPAPATRLRLTPRGRRVFTTLAAAPFAAAIAFAAVSGGMALASSDTSEGAPATFETITVMPGDTLWSIAAEVAPGADPRDVVDDIARLNALGSSSIDAGQTIAIPAEYTGGK